MADGVTVDNAGLTDYEVATDDAGADGHVQLFKLAISADGSITLVPATAADGLLVNLGANNDVVIQEPLSIDDNGGSLTVDGTVGISGTVAVDSELPAAAALADNTPNPTVPSLGSLGLIWDGANWDRAPGNSADGMLVNLGANNDVTLSEPISVDDNAGSLTVDNPILSVVGGGTEAAAQRVTIASDSTGVLSVDDNGGSLTVDGTVGVSGSVDTELPAAAALADTAPNPTTPVVGAYGSVFDGTNWFRMRGDSQGQYVQGMNVVDFGIFGRPLAIGARASDAAPTPVSADGDAVFHWLDRRGAQKVVMVDDAGTSIMDGPNDALRVNNVAGTQGRAAHDAAVADNPLAMGGRASTAVPVAVSADGDVVWFWMNRNGAPVVTQAPHVGLITSPWDLVHEAAQYTTTQTSTVLIAGGASEKIVVTKVQIQVGGTTAGTLQLYFGTGAFSRGTSRAIFDGEFAPSATLKPGVVMDGPFIAGTNGDDLLVTTSAAINPLTINVWYYVVT